MMYEEHDWYMDYDAISMEDSDESHLTLSFQKKAAARMASAIAAAEREKEFGGEGGEAEEFDFTGVRGWGDSSAYVEEKKKKITLLLKRIVPAPVPPLELLRCSRPLSLEEGAAYLEKACGDGTRLHKATVVTWYEGLGEDGRSCGPCHALWFYQGGYEFCAWLKYSLRRRAWLAVKVMLSSSLTAADGHRT